MLAVWIGDKPRPFFRAAIGHGQPDQARVPAHLYREVAALPAARVADGVAGQFGGNADQVVAGVAVRQE